MNKQFDTILANCIGQLPEYRPDDRVWKGVEEALDMDILIALRSKELSNLEPDDTVWEALNKKLDKKVFSIRNRRAMWISAASMIALAIAASLLFRNNGIITEKEYVESSVSIINKNQENHDPARIIQELCKSGVPLCNTDDFKSRMDLYEELCSEQKGLEIIIEQIGESPEIIQSIIKIENLKSKILQELIQMIHS